ncbi:hypothetical protein AEAC466_11360 [Asticcacaulis sp. AC466]|uniref:hypothetical protein n=1 Tax=Asticcacaulis sp. AC466 TaxID=1282362 RepID=UPI0003C3ACCA|nr:hypothetical protein [Asticcacaulis sp. AC466]ESQ83919.1 hypothetical protein AEAC466_11360 [Asticcacaulis sp. AC466]
MRMSKPAALTLSPVAPTRRARNPLTDWLRDFEWREGRLGIRKTGIRLEITLALINEIILWAGYLALLAVASLRTRLSSRPRPKLWFAPDVPRPWYLLRGTAIWAGFDTASSPMDAVAAFYFDDATHGDAPPAVGTMRFNHGCTDISKSHVARVFEEVFGYPLIVDPTTTHGEIVEKSEKNGVHDGRIVMAPLAPTPGCAYQRVVDTRGDDGCCHDLRTPCAGGDAVVVWIKIKTPEGRFSINNRRAILADPADIYSAEERRLIRAFSLRIGLDWGGLDILRDRNSGRIYIVDVNKTDLGPVIALSWRDKIRSMNRLSRALKRLVEAA